MTRDEVRAGVALASLLLATLSLFGAAPASAATLRVGKSSAVGFTFVPLDVGLDKNIFAQNGLDIEVVQLSGSAHLHQGMVAGAIDIGLGAGTDVAFLVKGAPEMGVGAISLSPALFGIVVPYDSPIKTPDDLKGKRIGISTVGSLTQWLILRLEQKQGWKLDDVTMVTVGSDTTPQIAAMQTGQIDAVLSASALGWNLEQQKRGRLLFPASDIVKEFLMNVVFASNQILRDDPDTVRRFLKAWYESVDAMRRDKPGTVRVARSIDGYSEDVENREYDVVMPSLSTDGKFPPNGVAMVRQSFVNLKILDSEPDMSKYLTEQYLAGGS